VAAALLLSLIADYDHGIRTLRRPMTFRLSRRGATNLQEHRVGTATDGHLRVVSLWESKEHADRFFTSGSSRQRSPRCSVRNRPAPPR
jgi:hypothetical protein